MQNKKTKKFDCVEMKFNAAEPINQALYGKSIEEQLDYWKKESSKFHFYKTKFQHKKIAEP